MLPERQQKRIVRLVEFAVFACPLLGIGGCWLGATFETGGDSLRALWMLSACVFIGAPAAGGILLAVFTPGGLLRLAACVPAAVNAAGLLLAFYGAPLDKYFRSMEGGFVQRGEPRLILANLLSLLAWLVAMGVACAAFRRLAESPEGLCRACGYNLAGNMSGVCPECGERFGQTVRRDDATADVERG